VVGQGEEVGKGLGLGKAPLERDNRGGERQVAPVRGRSETGGQQGTSRRVQGRSS
jgi:hypothetical protein